MYKKILIIVITVICTLGIYTECFAEVNFNSVGGVYTLNGIVDNLNSNMMSVKVTNGSNIAHASYIAVDDSGDFSYTFCLDDSCVTDTYNIVLTGYNIGVVYSTDFDHADSAKKDNIIGLLNSAADAISAKTAFEQCLKYNMISYPVTFIMTDNTKNCIYNRIAELKDFTIENFNDKMQNIMAVSSLTFSEESDVDNVITEYSSIYMFENEKYYNLYEDSDEQNIINRMFFKNTFENMSELRTVFNQIIILNKMNSESSHGGIVEVIKDYNDVFPKSVTDLSEDNKIKLALNILDKDIFTMQELEDETKLLQKDSNEKQGPPRRVRTSTASNKAFSVESVIAMDIEQKLDFVDIKDAEWARSAIYSLVEKSVINGYEDGDFKPNNNITREEFVKIVVNAFNFSLVQDDCCFEDLNGGHWAYSYICTAKAKGLISGISDDEFGIGLHITREDMAVIISNTLQLSGIDTSDYQDYEFSDVSKISDYAKKAVNELKAADIIGGYDDGSFKPKNNATRAEAAQMIYKTLKYAGIM